MALSRRTALAMLGTMGELLCNTIASHAGEDKNQLYQSRTAVTGRDPERRGPALIECFKLVLVKVSGDRALIDNAATSLRPDEIQPLIETISLRDQKAGRPVHDEQGTRDRPYDLMITFKSEPIDAFLAKLNRKPWVGHRPVVLALVTVRRGDLSFLLSRDGGRGPGMDEALANAADRFGLKVLLPTEAILRAAALPPRTIDGIGDTALRRLAGSAGAEVTLTGRLKWSEAALGWIVEWRLRDAGKTASWKASGINFDEAFRIGVGGAARILSGNGLP